MKVAVVGAGGAGGFVGSKLLQAGHDVTLIARGEHLRAMQERGLRIRGRHGELVVRPRATADPGDVGSVDTVLFAVKSYDTCVAAERARPLVGPMTAVLTVQNGIDNPQLLADILGREHILGGSIRVAAHVVEPGVIQHMGLGCEVAFSEFDGRITPRAERIQATFHEAGIPTQVATDMRRLLWEKLIFLAPISAVCTVSGTPVGVVRDSPHTLALLSALIKEAWLVGRSEGVHLDFQLPELALRTIRSLEPAMKPSMLFDRERRRRLEVEAIHGAIVSRAATHGVQAPVTDTLYKLLKLWSGDEVDRSA